MTSSTFDLKFLTDGERLTWAYLLEGQTARFGDAPCLRFEDETITYTQLAAQSRAIAKALAAAGVVKGIRVAVHMANRPEFVACSFAIAQVGAVLVPVNTFATLEERQYILRHSDSAVLLMQSHLLKYDFFEDIFNFIPEAGQAAPGQLLCPRLPYLRRIICFDTTTPAFPALQVRGCIENATDFINAGEYLPNTLLDAMTAEVKPSDEGVIIYTSGTTSKPKGVLHRQRAATIQSYRSGEYMELSQNDCVYTAYPFFWSAGLAMALGGSLCTGATLVLEQSFDPEQALQTISREKCNVTQLWPHQAKAMIEHPLAQTLDLSFINKEVCPMRQPQNPDDSTWDMSGSFGMTETFTFASNLPASSSWEKRQQTAGKLLPGNQLKVVDPDTGATLAQGEEGELCIKGPTLMQGYYKVDPELVFDETGFYHSADGGHVDDEGYIHWNGRLSNMIKTGGANVSPLEIEQALADYPGLRAAVVIAAPHPNLGEAIVLCAVAINGQTLNTDAIADHLKNKLATYKRPKQILLFEESDISFTSNQKIQVNKLQEKALQRLKDEQYVIDGINYGDYLS